MRRLIIRVTAIVVLSLSLIGVTAGTAEAGGRSLRVTREIWNERI